MSYDHKGKRERTMVISGMIQMLKGRSSQRAAKRRGCELHADLAPSLRAR